MTNAEKYLRDGVDIDDFIGEFNDFCAVQTSNQASSVRLAQFLSRKIKPTLTEDERAILRNIDKKYKYIGRNCNTELYLKNEADDNYRYVFRGFNHLFKFIKERRRISY